MLPDNYQSIIHFQTILLVILVVLFSGLVSAMVYEMIVRRSDRASLVAMVARHERIIEQNSCALNACREVAARYEETTLLVTGRIHEMDANIRHNDYCPVMRRWYRDKLNPAVDEKGDLYKRRKSDVETNV